MKKYLPAFICGFGAGVLQVVPVAKSFACCIIVPVAAYLALVLYQKARGGNEKLPAGKAAIIGLLTGFYAALFGSSFDIFVTFVTKNNELIAGYNEMSDMIGKLPLSTEFKNEFEYLLESIVTDIKTNGFSLFYTGMVFTSNLIFNTIFGLIGGLLGVQIVNSRRPRPSA